MIHGSPPFEAQRQDVTQTKIKAVEFSYPDSFPQEPRPIIDGLLKRDASSRMDMIDVIQSDWLKPFKPGFEITTKILSCDRTRSCTI